MSLLYAGLDGVAGDDEHLRCGRGRSGRRRGERLIRSEGDCQSTARALEGTFERIGLEAGPLSQWLYFGLKDAGLPIACIETRHAKAAVAAMSHNKTDPNDARSIAQLVRSGWFKTVHVKSIESLELRTLLTSREFLVNKIRDHENEIRGCLRPFGLKVGRVGSSMFASRIRELTAERPRLMLCIEALLVAHEVLLTQLAKLHATLLRTVKNDQLCVRFMGIPGVGPVTALAFKTMVDRPDRFRRSADVGAHLGLAPRQFQSSETDRRGRIANAAANVMLSRSTQQALAIVRRNGEGYSCAHAPDSHADLRKRIPKWTPMLGGNH